MAYFTKRSHRYLFAMGLGGVVLVLFILYFLYFYPNAIPKKELPARDAPPETIYVAEVGSYSFSTVGNVVVRHVKWQENVPRDTHYVLVDAATPFREEQKEYLQDLVKQKKIVALVGNDVSPQEVRETLHVEFSDFTIGSTMDVSYPLMGYGYSPSEDAYLPIFLGIPSPDREDIVKRNHYIYGFLRSHVP